MRINSGLGFRGPDITGCSQKNVPLLWRAIESSRFEVGIKVEGASERAGSELSLAYHNFSHCQIFRFHTKKNVQ